MIVGAAIVELTIHGSHSLKQRRGVVRSISQRLRNRFNLAVAEVGGQDTWQRAVLGLSAVGGDAVNVWTVRSTSSRICTWPRLHTPTSRSWSCRRTSTTVLAGTTRTEPCHGAPSESPKS
jgi:uncharacterized protein YlxP (DUF503 family)